MTRAKSKQKDTLCNLSADPCFVEDIKEQLQKLRLNDHDLSIVYIVLLMLVLCWSGFLRMHS